MATSGHMRLAKALPDQLHRFFSRYPPGSVAAAPPRITPLAESTTSTESSTDAIPPASTPEIASSSPGIPNPFSPHKHPVTGKWIDPVFSLRRQADLVKLARKHGVEELLPFTVKGTQARIDRRLETGLRVKGTGVGQKVKGKQSERTMKAKLEKRRQAMLEMPQMIQTWKERGHGRGWKKWPK